MIQGGEHFGFALKAREPIRIGGKRSGQDLESDLALQPCVARAIHLAHAADAQRIENFVRSETGARLK